MNSTFVKNLASRKLIFTLICFLISTGMLWFGKCQFQDWADFDKWLFGIYFISNNVEHLSTSYRMVNGSSNDDTDTTNTGNQEQSLDNKK